MVLELVVGSYDLKKNEQDLETWKKTKSRAVVLLKVQNGFVLRPKRFK